MTNKPKQFNFSPLTSGFSLSSSGAPIFSGQPEDTKKFSREDLEKAEKRGYEKGHTEGLATGIEQGKGALFQLEQDINSNVLGILSRLEEIIASLDQTITAKHELVLKLSSLIARKVAGSALKENAEGIISEFVKNSFPHIMQEKSVVIKVHSKFTEKMQNLIKTLSEGKQYAGRITVMGQDNVPESFCQIDWDIGGIELNSERMWQEIYKQLGFSEESIKPQETKIDKKDTEIETKT